MCDAMVNSLWFILMLPPLGKHLASSSPAELCNGLSRDACPLVFNFSKPLAGPHFGPLIITPWVLAKSAEDHLQPSLFLPSLVPSAKKGVGAP